MEEVPKGYIYFKICIRNSVASAVTNFIDGVMGLSRIFQSLDLSFGKYSMEGTLDKDVSKNVNMDKKTQEINKNIRKKKRAIRKEYIDWQDEEEGGESYISGNF